MDPVFINTESRKTSKPHVLTLKLSDKIDLKQLKTILPDQLLVFITHEKR